MGDSALLPLDLLVGFQCLVDASWDRASIAWLIDLLGQGFNCMVDGPVGTGLQFMVDRPLSDGASFAWLIDLSVMGLQVHG